jgi:hypothetical protein
VHGTVDPHRGFGAVWARLRVRDDEHQHFASPADIGTGVGIRPWLGEFQYLNEKNSIHKGRCSFQEI